MLKFNEHKLQKERQIKLKFITNKIIFFNFKRHYKIFFRKLTRIRLFPYVKPLTSKLLDVFKLT